MQYMEIIQKSFNNAWKYKFLWLFGFFVAISSSNGGGKIWSDIGEHRGKLDDLESLFGLDYINDYFSFHLSPIIILYIVMAIFLLWLVFWVMSVFSEGALIHGISRKELNLDVSFSDCWSEGVSKFFRLLGIMLLAVFTVIFILLMLIMVVVPFFFASTILGGIMTILALLLLLLMIIPIVCIEGWAIRYATLYDENWLDSIGKSWKLFTGRFGKTLGIAFSSFFAQFFTAILLIIGLIVLAIPFVILGFANIWLGLIPGLLVGAVIIIIANCFFGVFASSVWTIGFMQLTNYQGPQMVQPGIPEQPTQ